MNLIEKTWNKNKETWHQNHVGRELHHAQRKRKNCIERCCYRLFVAGLPGHENNYKWVEEMRQATLEDFKKAKANYVRNTGCRFTLWRECLLCAMPKLDGGEYAKSDNMHNDILFCNNIKA